MTRRLTEEELRVWEAATRQDERLSHAAIDWDSVIETEAGPDALSITQRPGAEQMQRLLDEWAVRPLVVPKPQAKAVKPMQSDAHAARKLRRGSWPVEAKIDLHGMKQDEARAAFEGFITRAHSLRRRVVLVITGKGRAGEGSGVLRRSLPLWLDTPACAGKVLSYTSARQQDGGAGAFYILLRRK